ncbi:hypothetical protein WJX72_005703 [[Myrmecia] bisecta]|uniref:T-complex-associated testis-expressed protein 1 n=1 Tax=[Myrmecia] bisecta TaxID=41462 RepID=A0AAW1PMT1_9CHLO
MAHTHGPVLVTPLQDLCLNVVAANFAAKPCIGALPENFLSKVVDSLSIELPLELAGSLLESESYWERRARARWNNCETSRHSGSWKQLFFERNVEDALEQFDSTSGDLQSLKRLLCFSKRFVHSLHLQQLPSHLDLAIILDAMHSGLTSLSISYGLKNVKMNYERSLFGMKLSDCRSLAKTLEKTEVLTYLDLSNNLLEDDKLRMIASGLLDNHSVTHLDLSHNKIADRGVRALAKLLDGSSAIALLNLCDNQIHPEGGRSLARAIRNNGALLWINLRLNRLGDEGGRAICAALADNTVLQRLNLSANAIGAQAAEALATSLYTNDTLRELDLSCNELGEEGGKQLREAMEENTGIQRLDLRMAGCAEDEELAIAEMLRQHAVLRMT